VSQRIYHIKRWLPELFELEQLINEHRDHIRVSVPTHISHKDQQLPFYCLEIGCEQPLAPTLVLTGGVHGIERIGSQVIIAFLRTLMQRLSWDPWMHEQLAQVRLLVLPIINPSGMWDNRRANKNGVDLMRNAPVDAEQRPAFMVGGHRVSPRLPWYRGKKGAPMEQEAQVLIETLKDFVFDQPHVISLDCHSGFGSRDRIWFPYAKSTLPWPDVGKALALTKLFETTYPNHKVYLFEPQAHSYTTHGDLWDHIYDLYQVDNPDGHYLPLTLEMGSWLWVKKSPRNIFSYSSLFNPILPHRQARIMRRHLTLLEFLMSAVRSMPSWLGNPGTDFDPLYHAALDRWYPDLKP